MSGSSIGQDSEEGDEGESPSRDSPQDPEVNVAPASLTSFDQEELTVIAEELRSENRRLREEYARARRGEYRRTAVVLLVLGLLAVTGGLLFPIARDVFFILGGIGLFGGVLVWYLTPDRLLTASVGQSVYESVEDTGSSIRDELGLEETNVYVPAETRSVTAASVRLFVPQASDYEIPDTSELDSTFVVPESTDQRGVSFRPTALKLVREFEQSTTETLAAEPDPLVTQVVDALVEQFELVDNADPEVDLGANRITVGVRGGVYDDAVGFDHPVVSFVGTAIATGLDRPVTVESERGNNRTVVTCRW